MKTSNKICLSLILLAAVWIAAPIATAQDGAPPAAEEVKGLPSEAAPPDAEEAADAESAEEGEESDEFIALADDQRVAIDFGASAIAKEESTATRYRAEEFKCPRHAWITWCTSDIVFPLLFSESPHCGCSTH